MNEATSKSVQKSDARCDELDGRGTFRRPRVWVLEDSPQQAAMVKGALAPLFDVVLYEQSPRLLEALMSEQPDVLVLDWVVPDISGLEVLRIVRQTQDEVTVPVLMMTAARTQSTDLLDALDAGANDFATKPFERAELRARVATLARIRRLHERARQAEQKLEEALAREEFARVVAETERDEKTELAQAFAAERNLLTAVLEHTPVGIFVVDTTGRALFANRRTEAELKHPPPSTEGVHDFLKWPILNADGTPLALDDYPASRALRGEEVHAAEVGYRFGDGAIGTLQVSYGPVRSADGTVSAGVVVFQDVTSSKAVALQDQKRAEFEKQLIGIVSHDLRTPIGAISLGAALLAKDATLTERQAKLVDRMVSSSGRASRMITDLLDFTAVRLGGGLSMKLAPVELHELARKVVAEVLLANGQQRQIELDQTGDAHGHWDGDRLSQLLVNLVANALHYSPRNSPVRVATHGEPAHVSICVQNGGPPIPAELLPRLFLPMQRGLDELEPSRRSVGLGLFIVDEIVRAHGGQIEVRSTAEEGTSFSVRLPREPAAAGTTAHEHEP